MYEMSCHKKRRLTKSQSRRIRNLLLYTINGFPYMTLAHSKMSVRRSETRNIILMNVPTKVNNAVENSSRDSPCSVRIYMKTGYARLSTDHVPLSTTGNDVPINSPVDRAFNPKYYDALRTAIYSAICACATLVCGGI